MCIPLHSPIVSASLRFLCQSSSSSIYVTFRLSYLVFLLTLQYSTPTDFFLYFPIFHLSLSFTFDFLGNFLCCLIFYLPRPIVSFVLHILLLWHAILPSLPFFCLCRPIVYSALLPTYSYARSLSLTYQHCSRRLLLFLPSTVECRGRERKRENGRE